ncbi:MAG: hypothetical protein QOJ69_56, partial [Actinomycetota bacterium]|nr:hypothetical protein [Actinomycetota bacterium]
MSYARLTKQRLVVLALVALGIAATSCTKPVPQSRIVRAYVTTSTLPVAVPAAPTDFYPLTGLPVDDPAKAARQALTVKIENEPPARPQSGLQAADVVYEVLIEGGDTRFVAIFHSTDADPVGSIRSVRPNDHELVDPIGGLFAYSGGTPKFVALLRPPIVDVGEPSRPGAYFSRREKQPDHRLFSSTTRLYAAAGSSQPAPPRALFPFLRPDEPFEPAGVTPASHVDATVGNQRVAYDWDPARGWLRSINGRPHLVEGGEQLAPVNVIVQSVSWGTSPGDVDTLGTPVPLAQLVGSGNALILSDGKAVRATWSKPGSA